MTSRTQKQEQEHHLKRIKSDFRNFLAIVWKHLGLPIPTPVQYDIAHHLQHGPKRYIIQAFRGVGKSWITSAFVVWTLLVNPQQKVLVISASKQRADDFSTFTKRLISEMPVLKHLKAKVDQRDSNVAFDVGPTRAAHAPSVKSIGITGQIVGSRADLIVADDVEVLTNSLTQVMRDKIGEIVKEFDAVLTPGGRIIYLGTPQTQETLYSTLQERGYETLLWPGRMPKPEKIIHYKGQLAPFIANLKIAPWEPTDPLRFDDLDLSEREASYGRTGFDMQFMLDVTSSDANRFPLKLADLIISTVHHQKAPGYLVWGLDSKRRLDELPNVGLTGDYFYHPMSRAEEMFDYQGKIMSIDPSGRGKDETGYCVSFMLNGMIHIPKVGGLDGGYSRGTLKELAQIAHDCGIHRVIIEENFGGGMFAELFKPVLREVHTECSVEEVNHSKQKELRIIDTVEPIMNQHRLVIDYQEIIRDYESTLENPRKGLFYQMTRITKDKGSLVHDDRLDALAISVAYWVERIAVDTKKEHEIMLSEKIDKDLITFLEGVTGNRAKAATWN